MSAFSTFTFSSTKGNKADKEEKGFALVELYTSEGCSSCPPAEEVIASLASQDTKGVYILAFHVDYWDQLGWKDPFSKHIYSERQENYALNFHLQSVYTPQVIVNGRSEFVGSNKRLLRSTIEKELKNTNHSSMEASAFSKDNKIVTINYDIRQAENETLYFALIQLKAQTEVKKGENEGKKLQHINVVRELEPVANNKTKIGSIQLSVPPGLNKEGCKIILFLQQNTNGQINDVKELNIQ